MVESKVVRVAVDAMGGDYAPTEIVKGCMLATLDTSIKIFLVGDPGLLATELQRQEVREGSVTVVPSHGVIREGESPVLGLRQNPEASIIVATGLVKEGVADACVSMGSTGATVAAAVFALGTVDGIERPALGGPVIGFSPNTVLIDIGASVDCRATQLVQFGVMGAIFAKTVLGIEEISVALLTVGTEGGKGNRQVREAYDLFQKSGLPFIGNLEGNDLVTAKATVVVCDGFIGNVLMKYTESMGQAFNTFLTEHLKGVLAVDDLQNLMGEVTQRTNIVEAFGGGPLFGVNGVSIIGHGRAKASAVARAIDMARRVVEEDFVSRMRDELSRVEQIIGTAS